MRSVVAVVVGLVVGIAAAVGVGAAVLSLTPAVIHPSPAPSPTAIASTPADSAVPASIAASSSPAASPGPSGSASSSGPSSSVAPSGSAAPTASPAASKAISPFPLVGQVAPSLAAPASGNGSVDLHTLLGRPVWVVFIGTYCPSARDQYALLNTLSTKYASAGLAVVAVDVKEDADTVATFLASVDAPFQVALDTNGSIAQAWQAGVLPFHYFVDAQGVVRSAYVGAIDAAAAAKSLADVMPGVTVSPGASPSP